MANEGLAFDPFAGPAILHTAPSTEPQRELWTASRLGDDASLSFNESVTLFFEGPLKVDALEASLGDLSARHEAIRSTFSGDGLTMMVGATGPSLGKHDWSELPAAEQQKRWEALLNAEMTTVFDLEKGPLFRFQLVKTGPQSHRATMTAHHIVCDGWSSAVLVKDWAQLYSLRVQGGPSLDPAEPFTAYARSQVNAENPDDVAYWLKQMAGDISPLDLPTDRARPPRKTYRSVRVDFTLEPELCKELKKTGAKLKASMFATLLAGFEALMMRLSRQSEVVVGIPAAGQAVGGHDTLVGHCVNTLALRANVAATEPFTKLLEQARLTMLDALEHQQFGYGSLLQKLPLRRDPSRLPLASVLFNLDRGLPKGSLQFAGLTTDIATNARHYENFDLFVNAVELDGAVRLETQLNADLFDPVTVERWMRSYRELLKGVLADPATPIQKLPILTDEERKLYDTWNDRVRTPPHAEQCAHQLVEAQAKKTPSKIAVEDGSRRYTYAELDARSNRIARKLQELGAGKGTLVGLCVERNVDMVASLFGVLKAGAAYVPLDPNFPKDRIAFMLEDSRCPVLVTQSKLKGDLPASQAKVFVLDEQGAELDAMPADPLPLQASGEDRAYVIYTSGSTGKPKGVELPHRAVVNFLHAVAKEPGLGPDDVLVAVTTLSFDIAVLELYLPLTLGAKTVIATREQATDGAELRAVIEKSNATVMQATPATWRLLLEAGFKPSKFKSLCGGEALPLELAKTLADRFSEVWNMYGPTETCVWSTCDRVAPPVNEVLIGRPLLNTDLFVVDALMQPVPLGVPGELFIGGLGVALGYLNRPELTKERFVDGKYRTGDVVKMRPDGRVEYFGRNDNQVKVRGYRIELGEIENALGQHPAARQVAVIVREDKPGDQRLTAYLSLHEGQKPEDAELRAHLKKTLPDYMVPQTFVRLDKLPLTPNGKIDRRALPKPSMDAARSDADFVAPRNDAEKLLADVWKQALGVGRVSVTDDFFALGGHSLLASQVLARLKRDHGVNLSFRKLFEAPTIEKLAPMVQASSGTATPQAGVTRRTGTGPAPASFLQQRMWLLEEMEPATRTAHHLPAAWRLLGAMDAKAFERCLDEQQKRHDTLRTTLAMENGQLVQKVHPEGRVKLEQVDLSGLGEAEREKKLTALMDEATKAPFNITELPLMRAVLYKLKNDEHVFFTVRHQVIWDGWSFDNFLKEIVALYPAMAEGKPATLPPLPVSYGDFAAWHNEWLKGPELQRQIEWWRSQYGGLPEGLEMPADRKRPDEPAHSGGNVGLLLPKAQHDALNELGRETGATLFMILYAAFDVLLYRWTQSKDLLVGTPVRNRTLPELEDLIGPFINAIAIRNKLEPSLSMRDFLARVRDSVLDAFNHQEMPFESLGTRPPVVRAFFSLQDARKRPPNIGAMTVKQVHVLPPAATNDLMLWCMETRDGLLMMLNYSSELFDSETAEAFVQGYRTVLEAVLADVKKPVSELAVLPREQLTQLVSFAGTSGPDALVHQSVPASGAAYEGVDFAEVSRRATQLQGHLSQQGLKPGTVAAIGCEGVDRLVAALAALRAGAAILPVDPKWSPEFLASHLSAGGAAALIASPDLAADLPKVKVIAPDASGPATAVQLGPDDAALAWLSYDANGKPALSTVPHRSLAAALGALGKDLGLSAGKSLLWSSALGSEGEALELLLPLVTGAKAVAAEEGCYRDGELLASELSRLSPTVAIATGAAWAGAQAAGFKPGATRAVCIGVAPSGLETTRLSTWLSRGLICVAAANAEPSVLGKPLPGTVVEVHDEPLGANLAASAAQLTPINMPGALWAGAKSSALRPAGERVRWRRDGTLERWGRPPKAERWGMRFPLELPSKVLATHEALKDAAVVMVPGPEERLAGFVVVKPGESFTDTELRKHVRQSLPQAMAPQEFHELEALPRDAGGAVDVASLLKRLEPREEHVPPKTPTEQMLADLWKNALGLPQVSARDNFFNLGGHSLLCFKVLAEVEKKTSKRVNPRLMLLSTLEQVAKNIDG
ncbi:MAG: amino acid adenylation domain-containing protein [Myxococcaceae bacterium]